MDKFVCIHGHFYQPPRENPWLDEVEVQDSAYPFHDWNERIAVECYGPNGAARILDGEGRIVRIVSNYSRMSFNFGPTLLSWLERVKPEYYEAVIEADRQGRERFSGHGPAIAQCFNHMIMPLADDRDLKTQVEWGVRDFQTRFGRDPEGMWLPETAVDLRSLEALAQAGIRFTIQAPGQAHMIRPIGPAGPGGPDGQGGQGEWQDVSGQHIDPTMPYLCTLPSGRTIVLFYYDGPISQDLAFGGMLDSGEKFADRLLSAFNGGRTWPQLVHIATDGESYGHHHKYGDMALAYCLHHIEEMQDVALTVYAEHLDRFQPTHEVQIFENSAWSCVNGVERWRGPDCPTGMHPGWQQLWRKPLREAMDWLRDELVPVYEEKGGALFPDPWGTRDRYVEVLLDRGRDRVAAWLGREAGRTLAPEEQVRALKLLEMQKHAMYMFTSCGWFFDEISGIETVQVMLYAHMAIQLCRELSGPDFEPELAARLETAPSNVLKNGREAFERHAKPVAVDLLRVGGHVAMAALFKEDPASIEVHAFSAEIQRFESFEAGRLRLVAGKARIVSQITWEELTIDFAALYLGGTDILCGVRPFQDDAAHDAMRDHIRPAFENGVMVQVIKKLSETFNGAIYSLWHLFRDEQRKIVDQVLKLNYEGVEADFRRTYEVNYSTLNFLKWLDIPLPRPLLVAADVIVDTDLRKKFHKKEIDLDRLSHLVDEVKRWSLKLDMESLGFLGGEWINNRMEEMRRNFYNLAAIDTLNHTLACLEELKAPLNLWRAQNVFFTEAYPIHEKMKPKAEAGDPEAKRWVEAAGELARHLWVKLP